MKTKQYTAFISYSHSDKKTADQLQKSLEHFNIPVAVREAHPGIPSTIRPIFKDDTDMKLGTLSESISDALDNSRFLIVVCSEAAAKSQWVNKEIERFVEVNGLANVIPVVVAEDGEVEPKGCLPEILRGLNDDDELLWINLRADGIDKATVKIIARVLDVEFDSIWQRHLKEQQRRRKRRAWTLSAYAAVLFGAVVFGVTKCAGLDSADREADLKSAVAEAHAMIDDGNLVGAMELLTGGNGLAVRDSRIECELREAVRRYDSHGWKCVRKDTFPAGENIPDNYGFEVFGHGDDDSDQVFAAIVDKMEREGSAISDAFVSTDCNAMVFRRFFEKGTDVSNELNVVDRSGNVLLSKDTSMGTVVEFALTDDGSRVVSAVDNVVEVTDVASGKALHQYVCQDSLIHIVNISMLSDRLAGFTAIGKGTMVYDIEAGKPVLTIPEFDSGSFPLQAVYGPDQKMMRVLMSDGVVMTLRDGGPAKSALRRNFDVVAITKYGGKILTVGKSKRLEVRSTLGDELILDLNVKVGFDDLFSAAFDEDNSLIVVGISDKWKRDSELTIYDMTTGDKVDHKTFKNKYVECISPNGKRVFLAGEYGRRFVYDIEADRETELPLDGSGRIYPNYDGSHFAFIRVVNEEEILSNDDRLRHTSDDNDDEEEICLDVEWEMQIWSTGNLDQSRVIELNGNLNDGFDVAFDKTGDYAALYWDKSDGTSQIRVVNLNDGEIVAAYDCWPDSRVWFTEYAIIVVDTRDDAFFRSNYWIDTIHWYDYDELIGRAKELIDVNR